MMNISNTHGVQLNRLNNLASSFISPWCLCHMNMQEAFIVLRPFHSNIIKSINSCISHTYIHTISFTPTTLIIYVGLCPNLMSSLYSLSISAIFPLMLSLPYFLYVFVFPIFPFYLFFYHIVNSIQPFPSTIGDQIWSWTTQSSYLIRVKVLQSVDVDRMNINLPKLHEDNHLK